MGQEVECGDMNEKCPPLPLAFEQFLSVSIVVWEGYGGRNKSWRTALRLKSLPTSEFLSSYFVLEDKYVSSQISVFANLYSIVVFSTSKE